jgi:hypothetical protein
MKSRNLTPIALSAMLACLSLQASAQSTCPTTVTTINLTSTASTPLTEVAINNKIKEATGTTTINLRGTFIISAPITIPAGIHCVTLQTSWLATPAVLQWNKSSSSTDPMITTAGNHDIALRNIYLNGRNIILTASQDGTANFVLDWVRFVNPQSGKLVADGGNYFLRIVPFAEGTPVKGVTITNSTFSTTPGLDGPYFSTAIMGYFADAVTISNNTFKDVDEGIHFQGLRSATLSKNTGTGLRRSAIEIQEGFNKRDQVIYPNYGVTVSNNTFTTWRPYAADTPDWVKKVVLGFSLADGSGFTVTNNILLYLGDTLANCQKTAVTAANYERWGMEFTGINNKASDNTICGFDWGFRIGFLGSKSTYTGTNTTVINHNVLANLYLTGIEMFGVGGPLYATDPVTNDFLYYTETPAQAKARWATILETQTRNLQITNNTISNARIAGFADGGVFVGGGEFRDGSPYLTKLPDGSMTKYPRLPDSAASHLAGLTIQGNKITRAYGFFPTDITKTATGYNDQRFTGLIVPAIRNATQLHVNDNNITLSSPPAPLTGVFRFTGITPNMMYSVDNGPFYDLAKTFNGSEFLINVISASSPNAYGTGLSTYVGNLDSWQGINIRGSKLSWLAKGVDSPPGAVHTGVTGNFCTDNVTVPGEGC